MFNINSRRYCEACAGGEGKTVVHEPSPLQVVNFLVPVGSDWWGGNGAGGASDAATTISRTSHDAEPVNLEGSVCANADGCFVGWTMDTTRCRQQKFAHSRHCHKRQSIGGDRGSGVDRETSDARHQSDQEPPPIEVRECCKAARARVSLISREELTDDLSSPLLNSPGGMKSSPLPAEG